MRAPRPLETKLPSMATLSAGLLVVTAAFVPLGPATTDAVDVMHLELERSEPAADATVHESPAEVRLWFTQSPDIDGTSVHVLPVGGEPVESGDPRLAGEDDTQVLAPLNAPLANGRYEVRWRAMARDGHVVRGTLEFRVDTAR